METVKVQGGKEHPTYGAVLNLAHEKGLKEIRTELITNPFENEEGRCVIKATVTMADDIGVKVFEAYGDATPKNVNSMIAPHLLRMAETRAKGRALRDAVNISQALAEELN